MTCKYNELNKHDALYIAARSYPGGVEALAARMGISPNVLYKKLRRAVDSHHLNYEEASQIIELLSDSGRDQMVDLAIRSFMWRHGYVAYRIPGDSDDINDDALLAQILKIISKKGILANNLKNALENDGIIDSEELNQTENDIQQCIASLMELKSKVKSMHEKPKSKKMNRFRTALLLMKGNHLSRAPAESGVRISSKLVGVLKRDCNLTQRPAGFPNCSGWSFGQIMTRTSAPRCAHYTASGLLTFAAGCFFW